jgi:hypothetical protein
LHGLVHSKLTVSFQDGSVTGGGKRALERENPPNVVPHAYGIFPSMKCGLFAIPRAAENNWHLFFVKIEKVT